MNNIIFISCILLAFSVNASAQQTSTKDPSGTIKANDEPVRQIMTASEPVYFSSTMNENDEYYGRKEEFSSMFLTGTLPEDFPKYKTGSDFDDYTVSVNSYLKKHASALIEKYKAKYE